jgi:hypothetical protein
MRRVIYCLALFASLIITGSCNLVRHDAKAYFWAKDNHENPEVLFIDGKNSGALPQISEAEETEDNVIRKNALLVDIPTGKYELELKNEAGKTLHKGVLEMKKSMGSESVMISWDMNADCKVKVFYQ